MPDESTAVPTIVLAIDGLRAAALGAYGQTSYETPAFDTLATEAITHEWIYASTPDPADWYASLRAEARADATLVTDEPARTESFAKAFSHVHSIESPTPDSVADSIGETVAAKTWEQFAEHFIAWSQSEERSLLWLHTQGLYGPWSAPTSLYESLLDEDDPEVEPSVTPPDEVPDAAELTDAAFRASVRYAGQVITLDACLAGWLELVSGIMEGTDYRLIVFGGRGFPLGEHGRIGGVDDRLFSEQQHVPLLVIDPVEGSQFTRDPTTRTLDSMLDALLARAEPSAGATKLTASTGARALINEDRMLRVPANRPVDSTDIEGVELYVRPDDRWQQNDIASLEESIASEMLAALLADDLGFHDSGVAATGEAQ